MPETTAAPARLTVAEYHARIQAGELGPEDRVELLEGRLVPKMSINPPQAYAVNALIDLLPELLPPGWWRAAGNPVELDDAEPEPDVMIVRGRRTQYRDRHPTPADAAVVIEVADSSLSRDRNLKQRVFAAAGVPVYWIVNLPDECIEVYTDPTPSADGARYATVRTFTPGDAVPVELAGSVVETVPASEVLP